VTRESLKYHFYETVSFTKLQKFKGQMFGDTL